MSEEKIEYLKNMMLEKQRQAESAAYEYFCACEVGKDREIAYEIYERIRNATRFNLGMKNEHKYRPFKTNN